MNELFYVNDIILNTRPEQSICCVRPHVITKTARWFLANFPGTVLFPVKTNPDPLVLTTLHNAGVHGFDVASLHEVELIANLFPDAKMYFMHTVKNREAIRRAYFDYGIRDFALDSPSELQKILEQTGFARDLNLIVRLAVANNLAEHSLSGKFGVAEEHAVNLLRQARKVASRLGITFHVGSQCMHPSAYGMAIARAKEIVSRARVRLDVVDVGGGFPAVYPDLAPPPLSAYMESIRETTVRCFRSGQVELLCEAGRAMVAESASLVVKVELRKGNSLYINDGVYGSLFDAGVLKFVYPVRLVRPAGAASGELVPFKFYGPTCDSVDTMEGPFYLPADTEEGDYIEIGQLGAYGRTMQSNFNGFASQQQVLVGDEPLMSMFDLSGEPVKLAGAA